MKVTAKGQVTIPSALRESTGFVSGIEVEFEVCKGGLCLRRVNAPSKGSDLVMRMAGRGDVGLSTDAILALTRGKR